MLMMMSSDSRDTQPIAAGGGHAPRGQLRHDVSLAPYTAWGIGGPARALFVPADVDALADYLASLPADEPLLWLGLGSNVLIRDAGFDGTVICLNGGAKARGLAGLARVGETSLRAEAGVPAPKVARFSVRAGLAGAEFMAGIPGTIGGALAMNAGAFGGETWPVVQRVTTIDRTGRIREREAAEYGYDYRHITPPTDAREEWFVAAQFKLQPDTDGAGATRVRELLARRAASQPLGARSCGSVFRNPPGDHAARLVEACGLKGRRIGDAMVSAKHANFIINEGSATAGDVEQLIEDVVATVEREHGVTLVREVLLVGDARARA